MSQKVLSISVKLIDAASRPAISIGTSIVRMTRTIGTSVVGLGGSVLRALTSVRGMLGLLAGGLAVRQIVSSFNATAAALDAIDERAQRLGLTAKELAEIDFVAIRAGLNPEELDRAFSVMARNLDSLVSLGKGPVVGQLERIGLSIADITDSNGKLKETGEVLEILSEAIGDVDSQASKVQIAQSIFGDSGVRLLPLLEMGKEGIAAIRAELEALGQIQSSHTEVAAEYMDALDRVRHAWTFFKAEVVLRLGPDLTEAGNRAAVAIATLAAKFDELTALLASPFKSGRDARVLQRKLADLITEATRLATPIAAAGVLVMVDVIGAALRFGFTILFDLLGPELTKQFIRLFAQPIAFISNRLAGVGGSLGNVFRGYALEVMDGLDAANEAVDEFFKGPEIDQDFGARLDKVIESIEDSVTPMRQAISAVTAVVAERFPAFEAALNRAGGFVDEYRRRWQLLREAMNNQPGRGDRDSDDRDPTVLSQDLDDRIRSSLSSGLTDGLIEFTSQTENAKKAWSSFATSFLRSIGQMILQRIIFNAISGNGFTLANIAPKVGTAMFGGIAGRDGNIRRYAFGTPSVPGSDFNRDVVPALLAPGEGVVNRQGVRNNPGVVSRMNRGESVSSSVVVQQTFHINGGSGKQTALDVGRAAAEGVLGVLRSHPSLRTAYRQVLA